MMQGLEKYLGRFAIPHLTRGVVFLSALVFILGGISPDFVGMLTLEPEAIMRGEVWRLLTFLFIPETRSILFLIFYLWFTWFVGNALEEEWGAFRLNMYFLTGMLFVTLTAFFLIGGQIDNVYFYSSLFLAFGTQFPKVELMLFPIPIPIQARFLAIFSGIMIFLTFLFNPFSRLLILASLMNYFLFFGIPLLWHWRKDLQRKKRLKSLS
ncbi:MAG: hypothetical protein ACOY3I_07655 [Verrucomicrobiota bacterium]